MVYARKQKFLNKCKEIWNIDDNDFLISYREINPKIQKALFFSKNKFLVCTSNYYAKLFFYINLHIYSYKYLLHNS